MYNLFNPENKFFTFMSRIADLMILNVLCILCCLPVVTAGASITATYYMTLKMVRNEETYVIKGFFHSFKENLKQGVAIHLILLLVGGILVFDLYFARHMDGTLYKVLSYVFTAGIFVYAMVFTYVYPILAKFYNTVKNTLKNALLMSIRHLPYTLLMLVFTAAPVVIVMVVPAAFPYGILFYFVFGFSVVFYMNSTLFVKIFDNYIPQEENEEVKDETIDGSVFKNLHPTNELPEEAKDNETL